jgi:hypothetical protein
MSTRRAPIGIAALVVSLAAFAHGSPALAQAGSTGGAIGKQGKSVSGGEESSSPSEGQERHRVKREIRRSVSKGESSQTEGPKTESTSASKIFHNPTMNGLRVNWCLSGLEGCGTASATAVCRSKGMARATDFKWEVAGAAYNQGGGATCKGFCGVFTLISCE